MISSYCNFPACWILCHILLCELRCKLFDKAQILEIRKYLGTYQSRVTRISLHRRLSIGDYKRRAARFDGILVTIASKVNLNFGLIPPDAE